MAKAEAKVSEVAILIAHLEKEVQRHQEMLEEKNAEIADRDEQIRALERENTLLSLGPVSMKYYRKWRLKQFGFIRSL